MQRSSSELNYRWLNLALNLNVKLKLNILRYVLFIARLLLFEWLCYAK